MNENITSCFVCGGRVSVEAKHCPHCAQPWPSSYGKNPVTRNWIVAGLIEQFFLPMLGVFILVAILFFIFWIFYG